VSDSTDGLWPEHLAYFTARAVAPDVVVERGVFSYATKTSVQNLGFGTRTPAPGFAIPLWPVVGEWEGYQVRPDEPRTNGDGKTLKFEVPHKFRPRVDVHPRARELVADIARPLWITESPTKGGALVSAGCSALALLGMWNWKGDALADFEFLHLKGRTVYITFDSDSRLNPNVALAMERLGAVLGRYGADVGYVYVPHGPGGTKQGVDDYLAAGGGIDELLEHAEPAPRRSRRDDHAEPGPDTFDDVPDEPGWRLLRDVRAFLVRYVTFPSKGAAVACALWVAHTHALGAFDHTPRLAVLSPEKRCGKSRLLECVGLLAHNARLSTSMSPAYLFRLIDAQRPTLAIDEVDAVFATGRKSDASEDLRALINSGFRRGNTVGRMVGEGAAMQPKEFDIFAPVVLAGIGSLPDTVLDRSVIIHMRRRKRSERVQPLRYARVSPAAALLRRRLEAWAYRSAEMLSTTEPEMPPGIVDRPADTWEPLLVVADVAGGAWPRRARAACLHLYAERSTDDSSIGVALLRDVRSILEPAGKTPIDEMFSTEIVEKLNTLDEAPWPGWRNGAGFRARDLADGLRAFGISSKNIRIGETQRKGYERADFADAWTRYVDDAPNDTRDDPPPGEPSQASPVPRPNGRAPTVPLTRPGTAGRRGRHTRRTGRQMVVGRQIRPLPTPTTGPPTTGRRCEHHRPADVLRAPRRAGPPGTATRGA
jgi:hypothetical protein